MIQRFRVIVAIGVAVAFGVFVSLAQAQVIFVPFLTPIRIEFEGLQDVYPVNGSMSYSISLKGYGSNCIKFEAQLVREDKLVREGEDRIAYFDQTQDCRKIDISQGAYNYTKSYSYSGHTVLGRPGNYAVNVTVFDQITRQNHTESHSFIVQ